MIQESHSIPVNPRFACDRTLGRLAKWLRILGYDTIFWNNMDDERFILTCIGEARILLTRNTRILKLIGAHRSPSKPEFCFIARNDFREQLRDVMRRYGLNPENKLRLCSECNVELIDVETGEVEGHVPDYVFETQRIFKKCNECGRYYWQGTHVTRMLVHLKEL